jgi:hypothetical protein
VPDPVARGVRLTDAPIEPPGDHVTVTFSDAAPGRSGPSPAASSTPPVDDPAAEPSPPFAGLPADPAAYDSERSAAARARGLAAPYIPGGRDPDQLQAESEDRRYLKLLLIMVVVIIVAGFVLGFGAAIIGLNGLVGDPG